MILAELELEARALLASDRVTAPTRAALIARLDWRAGSPKALTARQLATLRAVAARLVPLGELDAAVDAAGRLDAALAAGPGDGWRYAAMPADKEAIASGLDMLSADGFLDLDGERRDAMLARVRGGLDCWPIPSDRWIEEVIAQLVQLAYGHPLVQLAIGYDGMADAGGWPLVDPARA